MKVTELIDITYACQIASRTEYPLSYKFNDRKCIDAFSELLYDNETEQIDADLYFELVDPFLKENWHIIKTYFIFA